jgi:CBS domain-containing protein
LVKVRDVMSTNVPQVSSSATVLEACTIMNREGFSGVAVFRGNKAIGMLTDRALLRRFVPLNKRPDEVRVGEVVAPLIRIDPETSTKKAAKRIVENGFTRIGVFDGDKFLGWVTLSDVARVTSRKNILAALVSKDKPEAKDVQCPNCRKAFLEQITNVEGDVVSWQCPNCKFAIS